MALCPESASDIARHYVELGRAKVSRADQGNGPPCRWHRQLPGDWTSAVWHARGKVEHK